MITLKKTERMKNFKLLFLLLGLLTFASCNNNGDISLEKEVEEPAIVSTHVDDAVYNEVSAKVVNYFNNKITTRSENTISNEDLEKIFSPLVTSGKMIIDDLIHLSKVGKIELTEEERKEFKELQPYQFAAIAFVMHSIMIKQQTAVTRANSTWDCLLDAFGIADAAAIYKYIKGTAALATATAAKTIAKICLKRLGGVITVGYSIYEFVTCMKEK